MGENRYFNGRFLIGRDFSNFVHRIFHENSVPETKVPVHFGPCEM